MSNNFASDFYPDAIRKEAVGDLLEGIFDDQPLPVSRGQIKRDPDSTDDFEHLEQEFSSMRESRPPNLDFDPSSTISQRLENTADVAEARNLLDTTNPVFEQDLRPVPATPPPSANSDESDPFLKDPKGLPMDPKAASMAFMENERGLDQDKDLFWAKDDPLGKFDFTSSHSKVDDFASKLSDFGPKDSDFGSKISDFDPKVSDFGSKVSDLGSKVSDFHSELSEFASKVKVPELVPSQAKDSAPKINIDIYNKEDDVLEKVAEAKKQDFVKDLDELSFLKDLDKKAVKDVEVKDLKDDEDDSWNLVGKSKLDDAPTKPLPPLPKEAQFESFDPYNSSSVQETYEMSKDLMMEELMRAKQSGNETGDSEFESEPEPSPAKSVTKVKTEIRQSEDVCRRAPEKKIKDIEVIAPKDILGSLGLDAWFNPERLNPKVAALIYWRDPKKSGIVFGAILGVLLSLAYFSLISVLAYTSLLTLTGTVAFRIYKAVLQAVQKTSDGHPFKDILDLDLALPAEKVHEVADVAVANANAAVSELRRLFLVEDLVDTLKFGVGLWCLTYLGSWFNGMTLVIIGVVALFTLPKVYETNKAQIDQNLALVQAKINDITAKVKAAIPLGKKAEPTKEE